MTHANNLQTLSQFLKDDKTQLRFYDMSRRTSKLSLTEFEKFENAQLPYPYPYQQTAWVGILFWNIAESNQHNIWFIRFPLDEQGLINIACRDEFMDLLLSRIADNIKSKNKEKKNLTHALKDNPYCFKPTEENMAIFNAKAKITLKLAPSHFYHDTLKYLKSNEYQNWTQLGLQGFADVAVRQHIEEVNNALCHAIPLMPVEPFCAICNALENEKCTPLLTESITKIIQQIIKEPPADRIQNLCSALRAISTITSQKIRNSIIVEVLKSEHGKISTVLVIIAAKNWETLNDTVVLRRFLENLSSIEISAKQKLFNGLVEDLIFIPGNREKILRIFRDSHRSEALSLAIGDFFKIRVNENEQ